MNKTSCPLVLLHTVCCRMLLLLSAPPFLPGMLLIKAVYFAAAWRQLCASAVTDNVSATATALHCAHPPPWPLVCCCRRRGCHRINETSWPLVLLHPTYCRLLLLLILPVLLLQRLRFLQQQTTSLQRWRRWRLRRRCNNDYVCDNVCGSGNNCIYGGGICCGNVCNDDDGNV